MSKSEALFFKNLSLNAFSRRASVLRKQRMAGTIDDVTWNVKRFLLDAALDRRLAARN